MSARAWMLTLAVVVAATVASADIGMVVAHHPPTAKGTIAVTRASCAEHWAAPVAGPASFTITNHTKQVVDVQLLGAGTPLVFAEIFTLGPKTTRPLVATLAPGRYSWQCVSSDGVAWYSDTEEIAGPRQVVATPGYEPVSFDDLSAVTAYREGITTGLATLATATEVLQTAVDSGDMAAAKAKWLVAHLDYERLGAAYDTFDEFDDQINGRPDGLPGGVDDPHFTGFRRLEYALWHGQHETTLKRLVHQLDADVHGLVEAFPHQLTTATDVPLRAHEILENALQFELTGDTDEGSHTNLATVRANVDGDARGGRRHHPAAGAAKPGAPARGDRRPPRSGHARRLVPVSRRELAAGAGSRHRRTRTARRQGGPFARRALRHPGYPPAVPGGSGLMSAPRVSRRHFLQPAPRLGPPPQ